MILAVVPLAAALCALGIVLLKPLLVRYALARPNARSSHTVPTPQGGGIPLVGAALLVAAAALVWNAAGNRSEFPVVAAAALLLAVVGAVDDIRPLPTAPRLAAQFLAVGAVVAAADVALWPALLPRWVEIALLVVAGVWFVNLVNFMDGLDWITAAEMVPITAFVGVLGLLGLVPAEAGLVALALCGAFLGFAPFNKPVARLFLGDVGSLPVGLLVGWLLLELAGTGALAAALLLPLYHLADATITLLRRLARGERVWEAHRSHFYQQATTNGFTPLEVSSRVFGLNLLLAALAALTLWWSHPGGQAAALLLGAGLVGLTLRRFSRPRRP
ncbi:MAG TPA: glycosyl transferase [Microvirga sp.]|jgi:UDP-N-acetylmuramyl pentapeptide phosphotransferase/UDP-N-acetylglucosamine-1-phosphate transferase|nr:glycosyl transferase [Microvirga sp.]